MPKIVDKTQKRRDIALACSDLIYEVGIKKLTVEQVAKQANIGKGTVYEYFKNKEDIIFEIINMDIANYFEEFNKKVQNTEKTRDKVNLFFSIVLDDTQENLKRFQGYKEFLSIILSEDNEEMSNFNCDTNNFFQLKLKEVLQEGVDRGELIEESLDLAQGLLIFQKGLGLFKMSQKDFDTKKEFQKFINKIFEFIEVKK